jgi:hypothetical protein
MIDILVQYRWVFLVIAIVLLFAIIGFIVLGNKKKKEESKPKEVTPIDQTKENAAPSNVSNTPTGGDIPTSATPSLASELASTTPENFNVFASGNETDSMISKPEEVAKPEEPTLVINDPSTAPQMPTQVQETPVAPQMTAPVTPEVSTQAVEAPTMNNNISAPVTPETPVAQSNNVN